MKRAILKITDRYLMDLLSTMKSSYHGNCSVRENALPKDARIVRVSYDDHSILNVLLESEEFEAVEDGQRYPVLPTPIMEFVLVKEAGI